MFFCNSGTEAVEASLKFARRYWFSKGTPRTAVVSLQRGFHGRTMGALSVTWDEHYRAPFSPLLDGVTFVSNTDPAELLAAVSDETAAIIAEPLQGEGGVRPLSLEMAAAIRTACARTGALLIADEVQCGLGRTGVPFYSSKLGLQPDMISTGKALGGGVPVGAALFSQRVADAASFGDHGSTYGGNLLACRAAQVFLDELTSGLMAHVAADRYRDRGGAAARRRTPLHGRRRSRRRSDLGSGAGSSGGSSRGRRARARAAHQPHRRYGTAAPAAVHRRLSRREPDGGTAGCGSRRREGGTLVSVNLRVASLADASAIHALIAGNLEIGHLLPRSLDDVKEHIARFFVAEESGAVVACAELARLSPTVAEVRSLVVTESLRGQKIGSRLVAHLAATGTSAGYSTLCAFTHDPSHFVRLGFTIVPHVWMPEKIAHDCTGCALFRRCGQYAVRLMLRQGLGAVPERTAAMVHGRGVAPRRLNVERLKLTPVKVEEEKEEREAVLA